MKYEKLQRYGFTYKEMLEIQSELGIKIVVDNDFVDLYPTYNDSALDYEDILENIISYVVEKYGIILVYADIIPSTEAEEPIWFWLVEKLETKG